MLTPTHPNITTAHLAQLHQQVLLACSDGLLCTRQQRPQQLVEGWHHRIGHKRQQWLNDCKGGCLHKR
jgi:hypothetical protein